MSYKPDEKAWMAYLYGEMEEAEKLTFEEYILSDADARAELERYRHLRALLALAEDKEVIAPPVFVSETPVGKAGDQYFWNSHAFRTIAAVAASIVLIIMVGRITDTTLTVSDNEFRLTFGEVPAEGAIETNIAPGVSAEDVEHMIGTALEQNNATVHASLEKTQQQLEKSLRNHLALNSGSIDRLVREASTASQDQIRQYVEGIRTENMEQVKAYFQLTSTEQKQYIENLLIDFAKYLQQQRNHDLQLVQSRMNNIEQNTDLFKQETEQILSSIITTVGTPVQGETRY